MAWAKSGTVTNQSANDLMTLESIPENKFNLLIAQMIDATSNGVQLSLQFNNDTGSNYAQRYCTNGASTDSTLTDSYWYNYPSAGLTNTFHILYFVNIASEEKLGISFTMSQGTTGAGYAPNRREFVYKWANTSNAISEIDNVNTHTGDFDTGSNMSLLGSELTPVSGKTIETGSIYIDTDTARRWFFNGTNWNMQTEFQDNFSSDNWSDSTSYMGVSNGTLNITTRGATTNDSTSYDLQNYFGVNADNEKWVLRFKIKFNTSFSADNAGGTMLWVGLSDKNNTAGARTTTQDFIGISTVYISTGVQFSSSDFNDSILGWSTSQGAENDQNVALSASQYYYIEIKRTSATTYETGIYSDSNYLNALHTYTSGSTSSSVTNLRYIVCRNYDQQALVNSCSVTIDDMYFWNGVSSV